MEASAVIQGVELTHKTYYASNKSLKADVSFSIKGAKGQKCFVVALVKDVNGNYLNIPYEFKDYSAGDRLMSLQSVLQMAEHNECSFARTNSITSGANVIGILAIINKHLEACHLCALA